MVDSHVLPYAVWVPLKQSSVQELLVLLLQTKRARTQLYDQLSTSEGVLKEYACVLELKGI